MIEQSCFDPGITSFKHCMGKYLAVHLGIYIEIVLKSRINLQCYVYHKNRILSVSEKKSKLLNF